MGSSSFSNENYNQIDMDEFASTEMAPSIPVEEESREAHSSS